VPSEPPVSLLDQTYVVFADASEPAVSSPVSLGDDLRPCLEAATPYEVRFRVKLPPRPSLTFAIGIRPLLPDGEEGGGRVRFVVKAGVESPSLVVFQRDIHYSRNDQWIDQAVDLRRFAAKEIWLSFEGGPADTDEATEDDGAPLGYAALFAEPIVHDRARYREGKVVVVVSIDTLRRDHVSVYGYGRRTTPNLEALADQAVVFEDALTNAPWTLPAHASLLTSLHPSAHGAVDLRRPVPEDVPSLPRLLQGRGFFTQAVVTHLYLSRKYGFGHGFDRHWYRYDARAERVTDQAMASLRERGDRDFFLFLHYYDPHWHYDPPPPYDRTFDPGYEGSATGVWWDFKKESAQTIKPEDLRHIVALYDGEILYADRQLGRLFRMMKELAVFDKALVVVTSDHGEEFLEHGGWEHQKTLYEEVLRIPLLIKLPGGEGGGRRVSQQVSLVDVAPTIAEALEVSATDGFQGRSLLGLIHGSGTSGEVEAWSETEHTVDDSHLVALRQGSTGKKLIVGRYPEGRKPAIELFDLAVDPEEKDDLAAGEPSWVERALLRVETFLLQAAERRENVAPLPPVELTPDQLDKLRALGYAR
jgi:arylsulfatase A-like enzyme